MKQRRADIKSFFKPNIKSAGVVSFLKTDIKSEKMTQCMQTYSQKKSPTL
jgi:hypothetical protein